MSWRLVHDALSVLRIVFNWIANENKYQWQTTQIVQMLGMGVDMKNGTIRVTESKS